MNVRRICVGLAAMLAVAAAAAGWRAAGRRPDETALPQRPHMVGAETTRGAAAPAPPPAVPSRDAAAPSASEAIAPGEATGSPLTTGQARALHLVAAGLASGDPAAGEAILPLRVWAGQDPARCAHWVLENLTGPSRQRALEETVALWASQQGARVVLDWLDQQNPARFDASATAGAYTLALSALAEQDGPGAAAWLSARPVQGTAANWGNVLAAWAESDATAALQWVTTAGNLAPEIKGTLLPDLLTSFHDPGTTEMLLRGSQPAAEEDALVKAARATVQIDPAYSLGLARQIQNQADRDAAIGRALGHWLETDPAAAVSFAERARLPLPSTPAVSVDSAVRAEPLELTPPEAPLVPPR